MTTNSPNPVDGDVQALIEHIKEVLQEYEDHGGLGYGEVVYRTALAALTAEPVAWAHRLVNKCNGTIHPWVYLSNEKEPSEGDIFRVEVKPLYNIRPTQPLQPLELPFKRDLRDERENGFLERAIGWNECIDEIQSLNATAQPVSDGHAKIADALESLLWPNMASGNKEIINAAIQALRAKSEQPVSDGCKVPEGWKLVPIDPTIEMINGFWGEITHGQEEIDAAKEAYAIMLAAAPGGQDD